jgi:hypothetical protein
VSLPSKPELTSLPRRVKASRVKLLLGGGPHVVTTTVETVIGAGASPETSLTITKHWSSYLPIARFL